MNEIDRRGIEFLNYLYKDMYKSEEVMHGVDERFIGNKVDNIAHYIDRMQDLHKKVLSSKRDNDLNLLKQFYYRKYVIKEEEIPESYFEHQKEIYLERGHGHVEFNDEKKHEMAMQIINEQKRSLDVWIDYFTNNDSSYIPMWAKYWAFQGMLSLGKFDKKNKSFGKRSKGTTSPFVDLNREALALSIDFLLKVLKKESIDDKQLEVIVKGGSFGKIYSYVLTNILNRNNNINKSNEGMWVKYNQGTDHMQLVKSLQGYNTGWCTAGEETAKKQLLLGDLYVYYTYDEKKDAVVPRIAIRMEEDSIAEVRGVGADQNLESEMEEIAEQKLSEFPDKDKYKKKVSDMKKLTKIYKKFKNNKELSKEELIFLYEIDEKIEGFGYEKDSRIFEIKLYRNIIDDLALIFGCESHQVANSSYKVNENTLLYYGDFDLYYLKNNCYLEFPEIVLGNIDLSDLESFELLELPKKLNGDLILSSLENIYRLILPKDMNGNILLCSIETLNELVLPINFKGNIYLDKLTKASGVQFPKSMIGDIYLLSLYNADGLVLPKEFNGSLYLNKLISSKGLKLGDVINGNLDLRSLQDTSELRLPKKVYGYLQLDSIKSVQNIEMPEVVLETLYLNSLSNANGLKLPKHVYAVYLQNISNLNGVILPETFNYIYLSNNIVITPENVHKYIGNGNNLKK